MSVMEPCESEKLFAADVMSKRERVLATLAHESVDRVALLEQLSYNPGVIAMYTGRQIDGFDYTVNDICRVIRRTVDLVMPPVAPRGTARVTRTDGFVMQHDNWTTWRVARPFDDVEGACAWLAANTDARRNASFEPTAERAAYREQMHELQGKIGDTVILNYSHTGFCNVFDAMGLELFSFFQADHPDLLKQNLELSAAREVRRIHAVADPALSPVILIPEDFATKQGPIFPPAFLAEFLFGYVRRLADAWHEHGVKVLYHSDGNWRKAIPALIDAGVDGFYCLEPNCGMDIVELKNARPDCVWAGGVDGVDLLERGTPEAVRADVRRHILETRACETGGMFVASSSEINPPIPAENFRAMVEAVGSVRS